MNNSPHYFKLEQANSIVQAIRPLLAEILEIRQEILSQQPQVWPVVEKAVGNGGSQVASQMVRQFNRMDGLVREVLATGAVIKDMNTGLMDFLAQRDGRDIYLCWKYGEGEISYWHELDAGFTGRQQLGGSTQKLLDGQRQSSPADS